MPARVPAPRAGAAPSFRRAPLPHPAASRSWTVGKKGELVEAAARPGAHADRVTSLALAGGRLFSVSYDGSVRAWDAASLEPVADVRAAHDGGRLHCAVIGPDGRLYTGGDDQVGGWAARPLHHWAPRAAVPGWRGGGRVAAGGLGRQMQAGAVSERPAPHGATEFSPPCPHLHAQLVRRWAVDALVPAAAALYAHNHSVRALAAGPGGLLVSGDKGGEVAVWAVV
jgi:hypothetical protein